MISWTKEKRVGVWDFKEKEDISQRECLVNKYLLGHIENMRHRTLLFC